MQDEGMDDACEEQPAADDHPAPRATTRDEERAQREPHRRRGHQCDRERIDPPHAEEHHAAREPRDEPGHDRPDFDPGPPVEAPTPRHQEDPALRQVQGDENPERRHGRTDATAGTLTKGCDLLRGRAALRATTAGPQDVTADRTRPWRIIDERRRELDA